jgi:hypothetical protein
VLPLPLKANADCVVVIAENIPPSTNVSAAKIATVARIVDVLFILIFVIDDCCVIYIYLFYITI